MSVGKALEDFTDFVGRILGVYKDINTFGQAYRGLGSLVPKTPDFPPLPESVEKYLKEDVPVRNVPPVTQGTSPQLGPSRQGAVLSQGGFFRTPTQKTSKSMQAGRYSEGGKVEQEPAFLEALERQRLREQAFDNEFAIEVAAQSNYAADIDPSIARYHGMSSAAPGYDGLRGFQVTPSEEYPEGTLLYEYPRYVYYDKKNQPFSVLGLPEGTNIKTIFPESGTVAAIDKHATPVTYAHEYRHKFFPELSERENRIADLLTALDEKQLLEMFGASYGKDRTPTESLDYFRYDLRFERDNPGYGVGAKIFGSEWDRGARSTRQGMHEYKDQYIRARVEESPAIKLLNEYEALLEYNEELSEQNQERIEERQERESEAAVRGYATGGGVGSLAPMARNMYKIPSVKRGVGSYISHIRR